ncbi:MAG: STAS domain-containing protein [Deltaproteobacteria bacterium]|nr:STAS domain-containing protein [Deltaproteobacteria bacterium]
MEVKLATRIPELIEKYEKDLLQEWLKEQVAAGTFRPDLMSEKELRQQSAEFLGLLQKAGKKQNLTDITTPEWKEMREALDRITRSRTEQGFTLSEAVTFIFSFKQPLFSRLGKELKDDAQALGDEIWTATVLLDKLGLYLTAAFQKSREAIIARQQRELLELSTPVVKLWEGILALPLIGTLDSSRTQVVMENLLTMISETGSSIAIIDITGVPMVDTLVAQHLLKTVAAARLMGAECLISGVRPQIAQTIVHLGVRLTDVITKANLADAFSVALKKSGITFSKAPSHS